MTKRAREALADCEYALADYEAAPNTPFQRPRWVAVMTLLRTVGLVLDKVDRPAADVATQRLIDADWNRLNATKPEPRIFWEFIHAERNEVVHLYDPSARVNITIQLGGVWWNPATSESGGDPAGPTTYDHVMRKGPFVGRDPRELCREAIAFWKEYLDAIDRVASRTPPYASCAGEPRLRRRSEDSVRQSGSCEPSRRRRRSLRRRSPP
jgi:hypothetical protein